MKLELSKEQYENLIKMLSITSWILDVLEDADAEDGDYDQEIEQMRDLEQYILSKHEDFQANESVVFEPELGSYIVTQEVEDFVVPILEVYEDYFFWEELANRMVSRDLVDKYGEKKVSHMDPLDRMELEEEFYNKYHEEFFQNGLKRLHIQS